MGTTIWRAMIAIGFLLGQGVILYTFYETQKTTQKIETIRLMKDLSSDFFVKDGIYRKMRGAIESCEKLYTSWGGKFDHDEINRYLGFFEDVGFYQQNGLLNIDIVGHLFGAYIIEAYEYPEVKKYISLLRKNAQQPDAFKQFERLSLTLMAKTEFSLLASSAATMCDKSEAGLEK